MHQVYVTVQDYVYLLSVQLSCQNCKYDFCLNFVTYVPHVFKWHKKDQENSGVMMEWLLYLVMRSTAMGAPVGEKRLGSKI